MNVMLLDYTDYPETMITSAIKLCHGGKAVEEKDENLIRKVIKWGHLSVLEHVSFTYLIEGVSRVTTHQLVRHRMASYSQQSHRYTRAKENNFVCPPDIQNNKEAYDIYEEVRKDAVKAYNRLIAMGIKKEDARYIIPQAVASNIMVTMNARELLHFFRLRCAKSAQWEIRRLANKMLVLAKERAPVIFENIEVNENE